MPDLQPASADRRFAPRCGAFDNPEAYISGDRRLALAHAQAIPDRVRGAALFADISGFTPLTETLARELGPQRGAEELTANLNRVFHALIDVLDRYGGHVIYFSGDAITCWLDGDDGARTTACALAMQTTMAGLGDVVTPAGARVRLAMKVAIAVGPARRFVVGDPAIQLIDVLAGRLIDALAAAERLAGEGEIVLDSSALEALGDRVQISARRTDEVGGSACGVVAGLRETVPPASPPPPPAPLPDDIVRTWLLPAVHERLAEGRGEFLAELRPAYPLFIRFGGIDYDADDGAIAKLDTFVRHAQRIVTAYGGNVLQLTLGDKGAYLYAVFGSPHAHEDDAARAAAAALELRELPSVTEIVDIQIGIAHGRLRSGMYGHAQRQTFTCLGDAVNVAARLMTAAPPGAIYVAETVRRAAGDGFTWETLAPITVKGKAEALPVFALRDGKRRPTRSHAAPASRLVGRSVELEALRGSLDSVLHGDGRVVGLAGDAGVGKSRLIDEFLGGVRERGIRVAAGECQSYGRNTSYFVWRDVWSALFELDRNAPEDAQVRHLEDVLAAIDPALVARAPLLATLLDLPLADNDLTSQFDAKLRKTSLEGLLADALRARAAVEPLVLVLEDCHWLDPLSRDLLDVFARILPSLRVLIVAAYRPGGEGGAAPRLDDLPNFDALPLAELAHGDAIALIRAKLATVGDRGAERPAALVALVSARAQGNPFYIEELLRFIASRGIDPRDERALSQLDLPESLHSLILSRIDRLAEAPRQTLKVASVVGRVFRSPMLAGAYPDLGPLAAVEERLRELDALDLVKMDGSAARTYLFKHVVTRDVAYDSLPFAFRSTLHERVGDYIEETEEDAIDRHLDILAHHYWHSDNSDKKREYLGRAAAAAQASYANAAAIDYFERLAPLLSKGSRLDVLLKLGQVLELVGQWPHAEAIDREALELAESLDDGLRRASCQTALAEVVRKQGRFAEAFELLKAAGRGFAAFGDDAGVARVLHLTGTVAGQRGDYDKAQASYRKSLQIRERIGDKSGMASLLSNLGVIAEYRGDYDGSRDFHRRALALRESVGERWAIGVSMINLGAIAVLQKRFAEAREWFDKAMRIGREVGDTWVVANCHNNLGNATRGLGDYAAARVHYAESLRAYRDYDDRWALAFLLEDVGVLAALGGDAVAALDLVGATDAIREAIGAPRAPSLAQELEAQLAAAVAALPEAERNAGRAHGRTLDVRAAIERALAVCGSA